MSAQRSHLLHCQSSRPWQTRPPLACVVGTTPAAYAKFISDDYAKWGKVVAAAGIKPE